MNPQIATLAYAALIALLFYLDRDKKVRTSKALWFPIAWLMINGSRPVSQWLQSGPTIGDQYVDGSPLDAVIFGAIMAGAVAVMFQRRKKLESFLRSNSAILLFVSYCAVSIVWSDYPFVSLKRWVKSVGDIIMILVVMTDSNPLEAVKRFLCRCGFVLLPASILCIKYYPDIGRSYNPWTWIPMYCGVTTFKNQLGMISLVCAMASLWCFVRVWRDKKATGRWRHLAAQGAIIGIAIWLFLTADSMTSFSCFVLAGSVLVMVNQPWVARNKLLIHFLVAGVISLALTALFFDSSGGLVKTIGRDPTLTGRTAIWNVVIELAQRRPLIGAGFETFWMGDRLQRVWQVEKGIQEAHDGYIEVYINLGWFGILFLAGLILTGYRNVLEVFRRDRELGSIKLAYFVTGVIYSCTEAGFRMMSPVWIAFLLAVIAVPPSLLQKKTAAKPKPKAAAEEPELQPVSERQPTFASFLKELA